MIVAPVFAHKQVDTNRLIKFYRDGNVQSGQTIRFSKQAILVADPKRSAEVRIVRSINCYGCHRLLLLQLLVLPPLQMLHLVEQVGTITNNLS